MPSTRGVQIILDVQKFCFDVRKVQNKLEVQKNSGQPKMILDVQKSSKLDQKSSNKLVPETIGISIKNNRNFS